MTTWISREPLLFIFEKLDTWWASHIQPSKKFWPSEYAESFVFNFLRLDILCSRIVDLSEKFWPFEFIDSFHGSFSSVSKYHGPLTYTRVKSYSYLNFMSFCLQFRASQYIMHLNRTSEWNVMTIWISRTPPLFIFERLDISLASHIQQSQKLRPFEFAESFHSQFRPSRYITGLNRTSE